MAFDVAGFNAVSADFDLVIPPAQTDQRSIGLPTAEIAGFIKPPTGCKRVIDKDCRGLFR